MVSTPLKNISLIGMIIPNIWKNKICFQTAKQFNIIFLAIYVLARFPEKFRPYIILYPERPESAEVAPIGSSVIAISIDWFKGKIRGQSHFSWENPWFPADFPLSQPIDHWSKGRSRYLKIACTSSIDLSLACDHADNHARKENKRWGYICYIQDTFKSV